MLRIEEINRLNEIVLDGGVVKLKIKDLNDFIDNLICYEKNVKLNIQYHSLNSDTVVIKLK